MTRQILIIAIVSFILTQIAIFSTSIYLHRALAHRALSPRPLAALLFRAALWLLTGQNRQQWVAVHRKHHTFTDREGDPHSPLLLGLLEGPALERLLLHPGGAQSQDRRDLRARSGPRLVGAPLFSWGWTGLGARHRPGLLAIGWWQGIVAMLGHAHPVRLRTRPAHQRPRALDGRPELPEHGLQLARAGLADRRARACTTTTTPSRARRSSACGAPSSIPRGWRSGCWPLCVSWRSRARRCRRRGIAGGLGRPRWP